MTDLEEAVVERSAVLADVDCFSIVHDEQAETFSIFRVCIRDCLKELTA